MTSMVPPAEEQHPRRLSLSFTDPAAERDYWQRFADEFQPYFRVGVVAIALLLLAFAPVDAVIFPRYTLQVWLLRYGLAFPALGVFAAFLWVGRLRPIYRRRVQELLFLAGLGTLAGVTAAGPYFADGAGATELYVGSLGVLVSVQFLYGFSRMRFLYAGPLGAASIVVAYGFALVYAAADTVTIITMGVFAVLTVGAGLMVCYTLELYSRLDYARDRQLKAERERSQDLLHNILPAEVASRLEHHRGAMADRFEEVGVLFVDIAGFTALAEKLEPTELVTILDRIFSRFDELTEEHDVEKIKTIGDAYMVAAGVPRPQPDHARRLGSLALQMRSAVEAMHADDLPDLDVRIGLDCGPVLAGILGRYKFCYDLWGDTVNTAARMESHGLTGRIQVTDRMRQRLMDDFELTERGPIEVKGKGTVHTWWLEAQR